jgi:hypothetical protein
MKKLIERGEHGPHLPMSWSADCFFLLHFGNSGHGDLLRAFQKRDNDIILMHPSILSQVGNSATYHIQHRVF